jgi:amidophosphoribosyltransferase
MPSSQLPDSARAASTGLAATLGVPYREGFVKNRYRPHVHHAGPRRAQEDLRHKLDAGEEQVRRTSWSTTRSSAEIRRARSSRWLAAPERARCISRPIRARSSTPCVYGIDMSTRRQELMARERSNEEIALALGADAVFQTLDAMNEAVRDVGAGFENLCNASFDGKYPTPHVNESVLLEIERDRAAVR